MYKEDGVLQTIFVNVIDILDGMGDVPWMILQNGENRVFNTLLAYNTSHV